MGQLVGFDSKFCPLGLQVCLNKEPTSHLNPRTTPFEKHESNKSELLAYLWPPSIAEHFFPDNRTINIKLVFIIHFPSFGNGPINRTALLVFQDGVKLHDITVSFVRGTRR